MDNQPKAAPWPRLWIDKAYVGSKKRLGHTPVPLHYSKPERPGEYIEMVSAQELTAAVARARELEEALEKYRVAMDKLYNHNEATRQAVILHFGLHHPLLQERE